MSRSLVAQPLTAQAFAPFGQVIETTDQQDQQNMNDARFSRFDALAHVDVDGPPVISLARCEQASSLPYQIQLMERHPRGSQAFIPLSDDPMIVVVATPGEQPKELVAFQSNGFQGISYHRGVWHMPLISFASGQTFIVVDTNLDDNCDEWLLPESVSLSRA